MRIILPTVQPNDQITWTIRWFWTSPRLLQQEGGSPQMGSPHEKDEGISDASVLKISPSMVNEAHI